MDSHIAASPFNINYTRVVSLSHLLHPDILLWPGDPAGDFQTVSRIHQEGYYLRRFCLGEHSGTHLNAPASFHADGMTVESYQPQALVAQSVVIDLKSKAEANPDYLIALEDAQDWEKEFGRIPTGSVVLLYTGWQARWDSPQEFFNQDSQGRFHFPGFSLEVTRFLLEQRKIGGIGIDTHGVDGGQDDSFAVNRLVLQQPRIVLENLANLDQLPPVGATLVIGVLPLRGGSGSPVSVLALVP